MGVDMVEFDVHVCGSGEVVVIHDETVDRTTDGSGSVRDMPLGELKELDAGLGETIPTLNEALSLIDNRVKANIELKGDGTVKPVYGVIKEQLERGWSPLNLTVSSFEAEELSEIRELSDEIGIGALTFRNPFEILDFAEEVDAFSVNPYFRTLDENLVEEAHNRGFKVFVWTVNEVEDIEKMKSIGVDGIISDYPDRIRNMD